MQLSTHFSQERFEASTTASRLNIDNKMNSNECSNAVILCNSLLEPIYNKIGRFSISSGFRCKELNSKIGGSKTSQHCEGKAVDIIPIKLNLYEFMLKIKDSKLIYDQLILEFGWCHLSYNGKSNRRQNLKALHSGGTIIYQNL